jgi:hypothetical protein
MHKRYSRCKSEDHHVVEPSFIDELHVATFSAFWCHCPCPYCFLEYPEIGVYRGREGSGRTKYAFIPPPTSFRSCHYALAVFVISKCLRVPVSSNRHHLLSDLLTIPSLLFSQPTPRRLIVGESSFFDTFSAINGRYLAVLAQDHGLGLDFSTSIPRMMIRFEELALKIE